MNTDYDDGLAWRTVLRKLRLISVAALILCGAGACHRQPPKDLLDEGVYLFNEARFEEAIPVLKKRLLDHPWDPGAHYYLGRSYLSIALHDPSKAYFVIAEGELKTALRFFIDGGRHSPIKRFSDVYFEVTCHLQISNVYLAQAAVLEGFGATRESIDELLQKIENENRAIRALVPESAEVKQYEEEIANIRNRLGIAPAPTRTV